MSNLTNKLRKSVAEAAEDIVRKFYDAQSDFLLMLHKRVAEEDAEFAIQEVYGSDRRVLLSLWSAREYARWS